MDDGVLSKVVSVEREIQARLEAEKEKAAAMVGGRREAAALRRAETEVQLDREAGEAVAAARREAEALAAELLQEADREAGRLSSMSDDFIERITRQTIFRIIPGQQP